MKIVIIRSNIPHESVCLYIKGIPYYSKLGLIEADILVVLKDPLKVTKVFHELIHLLFYALLGNRSNVFQRVHDYISDWLWILMRKQGIEAWRYYLNHIRKPNESKFPDMRNRHRVASCQSCR